MFSWYVVDFHVPYLHRYRISPSDDINTWMGRQDTFWNETFWYISPWLVIDYFIPRRKLPLLAPTLPEIVWQIFMALVVFDVIFFLGHKAFHNSPYLYKQVHAVHHTAPIIRATDAIRHTFWDGTWDVFCSVVALNSTRAHPLSRACTTLSPSLSSQKHIVGQITPGCCTIFCRFTSWLDLLYTILITELVNITFKNTSLIWIIYAVRWRLNLTIENDSFEQRIWLFHNI